MTPTEVIEVVRAKGVNLAVEGDYLKATPAHAVTAEVRHLVAANRPALLAALRPLDLRDMRPAGLAPGTPTVMCRDCRDLEPRQAERPDGWCRAYQVETWQRVPFSCNLFFSSAACPRRPHES